jgi:hypothetical protein
MLEFGFGYKHAVGQPVCAALSPGAPRYDQDAVTTAATRRLDDEALAVTHGFRQATDISLVTDDPVKLGNRHTGIDRQGFCYQLVIDTRVKPSRVEAHDEIDIALVHAQHARFRQLFCSKHAICPLSV